MSNTLIKDSELRKYYDKIIENAPSAIIIFSVDGDGLHFRYTSEKCIEISGFTQSEIYERSAKTPFIDVHPDDRYILNNITDEQKESYSLVYRIYTKNDAYKWVRVTISRVQEEKETMFYGFVTDIDAEYKKELEIQKRDLVNKSKSDMMHDMYQKILDETKGMITVIDGESKEIVYANAQAIKAANIKDEYIGNICYQAIQNRDCVCQGCLLNCGNIGETLVSEVEYGQKIYKMIKKVFLWNGKRALLEYSEDITTEKNKQNMLQKLIDEVPTGVGIYELVGEDVNLTYLNNAYYNMLGSSRTKREKFYGKHAMDAVHPDDKIKMLNLANKLKDGANEAEVIHRVKNEQGEWIYLMFKAVVIERDKDYIKVYAGISDYTKVMKANQLLSHKYNIEKTRIIRDESMVVYGVFDLSHHETMEFEVGRNKEKNIHTITFEQLIEDTAQKIAKEEQQKQFVEMADVAHLIQSFQNGQDELELDFQAYNLEGNLKWTRCNIILMEGFDGDSIVAVVSCFDIHKTKTFELISSHMTDEQFDMSGCVNLKTDDAVMIYGKGSAIRELVSDYSVEGRYSLALEWFINHAVVEHERKQFRLDILVPRIKEELKSNSVYKFILHTVADNGEIRTKEIKYFNYDRETEIVYFAQNDITDLIKKEEEEKAQLAKALDDLHKANEATNQFLARMSHDMRTPMNGILGMVKLSNGVTDVNVLNDNISKIEESGKYLLGLINDTLDFQKIQSGKLSLNSDFVDVNKVVHNICNMVRNSAEEKGVDFKFVLNNVDLKWHIKSDEMRLQQIFLNLLSNAIKFTPAGGSVEWTMELIEREGMISHDVFTVRDTGIGMSEEFLKNKLFKPFAQEYNDYTNQYAGSGLGLSIVESLVKLMHGKIEVESELGRGTVFRIYLDFERVNPSEVENYIENEAHQIETANHSVSGKKILLVEDHPLNAEITKRLLSQNENEIDWCKNGQEGVDTFKASKIDEYDLILMDIRMPVLDGLAATKAIRLLQREDAAKIPIIAMTANAFEEDMKACFAAGMNGHVAKPVDVKILLDTITKCLNNKK